MTWQMALLTICAIVAITMGWITFRIIRNRNMVMEELSQLRERASRIPVLEAELLGEKQRHQEAITSLTAVQTQLDLERKQTAEKIEFLQSAKESLTDQFKNLANEILEEKTKKFTDHNKENLFQLLSPLQDNIQRFQKQVKEAYDSENEGRSKLLGQIEMLHALNKTISEDAQNLTKALKGSSKIQGNWGEMILERILEESGLRKGHEYRTQVSAETEAGNRVQPDVIIRLPENRQIIVDAKVSLVAYESYMASENEADQAMALKRHVDSVRTHIKTLSSKEYQNTDGLSALDFVMLFMPLEPAFMLAIAHDPSLWEEAWRQNVILVGPSTLLFALRTVEHLWRQEHQSRNAQAIADRGRLIYDQVRLFIEVLEDVGNRIGQAQKSYDLAYKRLCQGQGNLLGQAQKLEELGVRPTQKIADKTMDQRMEFDEAGDEV